MKFWHIAIGVVAAAGVTCAIVLPLTLNKGSNNNQPSNPAENQDSLGETLQNKLNDSYYAYETVAKSDDNIQWIIQDEVYLAESANMTKSSDGTLYYYSGNNGFWYEYVGPEITLTKVSSNNYLGYYIYH